MSKNVSSGTIKTNAATADVYKTNRYNVEKQNPSNETKMLQSSLNSFGYVGKDNKPLKVDGAYGPNTDHTFTTAWKNNEQVIKNNELAKERDKVAEAVNKAYTPLMEKAETRKWNMPKEEVETSQNFLNDFGYTDWWNQPLKVDGILGPKTRGALEKHIQDGTPKQEVYDMQKLFNEMGITDRDGNALKQDGKLGVKTDGAVHKAVKLYGGINDKDLEPVRWEKGKSTDKTLLLRTIDNNDKISREEYRDSAGTGVTLHNNPEFQKVQQESRQKNIEIKNKPDKPIYDAQKYDIPYQYKVTDEDVLDEFDMMKINALKGLYNWAIEQGDRLTADKAHKAAVDIRSNAKYNGKGYGENYRDNYIYSDEFDKDDEFYSLVETPLDKMRVKQLHSNWVDDLVDSGGLSLILKYLASAGVITPVASNFTDIISQLFTGFGDGIDKYVPTVQEGDIPITLGDKSYYYRPSDGTVIEK